MTVHVYKHTDAGAPVLTGEVGALKNLLKACLVDGYNAVSVASITRSGTTVTVTTSTAHGFNVRAASTVPHGSQCALISGAAESDYNGTHKVATIVSSTVFTFEIATTPATPATGTITCKRAPAGWAEVFTGTDKSVFRAGSGLRHYMRVLDTDARDTRVMGYETMTDVDTGAAGFPTNAQMSGGGTYWWKSGVASNAARGWTLTTNGVWINFLSDLSTTMAGNSYIVHAFGEFPSEKASDLYSSAIIGQNNSASSPTTTSGYSLVSSYNSVTSGHYLCRNYTGLGSAIAFGKCGDYHRANQTIMGNFGRTYPSPVSGKAKLSRVWINEPSVIEDRGLMPGIWYPIHSVPFSVGDWFSGGGAELAGREFEVHQLYGSGGTNYGQCCLEISDTW